MAYAIDLFFDLKSEHIIREIWHGLATKGISTYLSEINARPHITLGIYHEINFKKFEERLSILANRVHSFDLTFSHIGTFPGGKGTVFLAPAVTNQLSTIYTEFHDLFYDHYEQEWEYYKPNFWIPHCTLSMNTSDEEVPKVIEHVLTVFKPMDVTIKSIGVVKLEPVEYLLELELQ